MGPPDPVDAVIVGAGAWGRSPRGAWRAEWRSLPEAGQMEGHLGAHVGPGWAGSWPDREDGVPTPTCADCRWITRSMIGTRLYAR